MENLRFISLPYLSISPTTVTVYSRILDTNTGDFVKRMNNNILPEDNKTKGLISKKSYSRIYKRIFTFLYNIDKSMLYDGRNREKVGFMTLTLPSSQIKSQGKHFVKWHHSDVEIKSKCLNQLFVELRKEYGMTDRIWKAEKQKNGNIHFHILVDKFIPHDDLRKRWNRIINKLGYVDRNRSQMCKYSEKEYVEMRLKECSPTLLPDKRKKLICKFKETYKKQVLANWMNPNTVDIHSLYKDNKGKKVTNVVAYIAKYMSKDESFQKCYGFDTQYVDGRIWYCSQLISRACSVSVECTDDLLLEYDRVIEKMKDVYIVSGENFHCACFSIVEACKKGMKKFDGIFDENLKLLKSLEYG